MGTSDVAGKPGESTRRLTQREAEAVLNGTARYAHLIPIVDEGSPLRQGFTYIDLSRLGLGPFIAVAGQSAIEGQLVVPRRAIDPELWLQLVVHEAAEVDSPQQADQAAES